MACGDVLPLTSAARSSDPLLTGRAPLAVLVASAETPPGVTLPVPPFASLSGFGGCFDGLGLLKASGMAGTTGAVRLRA